MRSSPLRRARRPTSTGTRWRSTTPSPSTRAPGRPLDPVKTAPRRSEGARKMILAVLQVRMTSPRLPGKAYVGNRAQRSFPRGLEVEVVTAEALRDTAAEADEATAAGSSPLAAIRARPDRYPQAHVLARRDGSRLDWRVKTPADLAFA